MIKTFLLLVLTCSFHLSAQTIDLDELESLKHGESDCGEVRLDLDAGPTANIPSRDQGQVGSCTAHASAILIDAYLAKKYPAPSLNGPPNHLTSPFSLYVNEKISNNFVGAFDGDAGSDIPNMIQAALTGGSCDLSDTSDDRQAFEQLIRNLKFYDDSMKRLDFLISPPRLLTTDEVEERDMMLSSRGRAVNIIMCRMEKFFLLPQGIVDAAKANNLLNKHQQASFWNEYLKERCIAPQTKLNPKDMQLPKLKVLSRLKGPKQPAHANKTVADLQRAIDENLTQKKTTCRDWLLLNFFSKGLSQHQ